VNLPDTALAASMTFDSYKPWNITLNKNVTVGYSIAVCMQCRTSRADIFNQSFILQQTQVDCSPAIQPRAEAEGVELLEIEVLYKDGGPGRIIDFE